MFRNGPGGRTNAAAANLLKKKLPLKGIPFQSPLKNIAMPMRITILSFLVSLCIPVGCFSQHEMHHHSPSEIISNAEPQPLLAQALRLNEALNYLGSSLSKEDQ